ncbi:MAG: TIM barrel protein [Armatimonadota bacterium]|nr:TIM barrel protein [Armatimonadota bacterium]
MYADRHWRDMMDLGIVHFMAYPIIQDDDPQMILETAQRIAEDDFFDVLEVRRSQHQEVMDGLKQMATTAHLSLGLGAQPPLLLGGLDVNSLDDAERQRAVDDVKKSIDAAYELDCRICAFLSGPDVEDSRREDAMSALVDSCVELCEYSTSKAGDGQPVWLSLEQFDDTIDKKCLIGPSERAAELAERVKEQVDNFGLTQDLSHMPLLGETPQEMLSPTIDHLIHVHVGNAIMADESMEGYGDKHPGFGYPGSENDVPELARFLETLIYVGYFDRDDLPTDKPVVTFEVSTIADEDPDLVVAGTKRAFHAAWSML